MEDLLNDAGFVSIQPRTYRIPLQMSLYDGSSTHWLKAAMVYTRDPNGTDNGFVSLSLAHFVKQLGWSAHDVRALCKDVGRVLVQTTDDPHYINLRVWTACKP